MAKQNSHSLYQNGSLSPISKVISFHQKYKCCCFLFLWVVSSQFFLSAVYFLYSSSWKWLNLTDTSTKLQMVTWTVSSHIYYWLKLQIDKKKKKIYSLGKETGSLAIRGSFQEWSVKVHYEFHTNFHPKNIILLIVLSFSINVSLLHLCKPE